jgi:uncharacterized membrane protein
MIAQTLKKEWYILLILFLPFAVSIYLYPTLPDTVPIHFNAAGQPDDWGPKWLNAFLLPVISMGLYFVLLAVPFIDPKQKLEPAQKQLAGIRLILSLFMLGIYAFVMIQTINPELNMVKYVLVAVGILILAIGNYMNTIKPNYFIGIRTPWTLEDESNWKKTHSFTARLWTVSGIILAASGFVFAGTEYTVWGIIGLVIIISIIPVIYSYKLYKKGQTNEKAA